MGKNPSEKGQGCCDRVRSAYGVPEYPRRGPTPAMRGAAIYLHPGKVWQKDAPPVFVSQYVMSGGNAIEGVRHQIGGGLRATRQNHGVGPCVR